MNPTCALCLLALLPVAISAQTTAVAIPAGTPLPVKILGNLPMKAGEPLRTELLYPVYVDDKLVLPAKTIVIGKVVSLTPDRTRRIHARLRIDFTPFHIPVVEFNQVQLADGTKVPLTTGTATDGAPIYRLVAPPPRKGSALSKGFAAIGQGIKDRLSVITAPDKGDRLTQFLWSQLPLHPERIAKDTAWTVETAAPLELRESSISSGSAAEGPAVPSTDSASTSTTPTAPDSSPTWILQAYLNDPMSSATAKAGQPIHATVAEPILNPDGSVAVPTGSVLTGAITAAKPARSFARDGTLRFRFTELKLPGEDAVAVQAALTGADSATGGDMAMNSEGEVKPKPQDKIVFPLILLALARGPLDRDGGRHRFRKDAGASNALGFLGFIAGTVARQPYLAAGIGYYGAAISIYERIFRTGKQVAFARDTRIVLQTTARRSAAIKPNAQPAP
jgi:hypothetical protein